MTLLQIVNRILTRLREDTVQSLVDSDYAALIGLFVSDGYEMLQENWDWEALKHFAQVDIVPGQTSYIMSSFVSNGGGVRDTSFREPTADSELVFDEDNRPQVWVYQNDSDDTPRPSCTS